MKNYNLGILGASGEVGLEMISLLEERNFPVHQLFLYGKHHVGQKILFKNKEIEIKEFSSLDSCDVILGAVSADISKQYLKDIQASNALYIDNSSAFRLDENVPLVIPEINSKDLFDHHGIISNPNCSTIIGCMAIYSLHQKYHLEAMTVTTLQAVSGAGKRGIVELENQIYEYVLDLPFRVHTFETVIMNNVLPKIGDYHDQGSTTEEMKMQNEMRKIFHAPHLQINCTCVRVPVMRSHSLSMTLTFQKEINLEECKELLMQMKGCQYIDESKELLTPLNVTKKNDIYVSRIRAVENNPKSIVLWCCGDQLKKGAALNAIQILEKWSEEVEKRT